ncbi:MAG: hypothetical protein K9M07_01490 [Simkaniaceae bacterium]|nr:hypothetical protein [Simkaniaceae bacterium]MCF7851895.1 hypothetical protein [Simkaniaceae bacterium]
MSVSDAVSQGSHALINDTKNTWARIVPYYLNWWVGAGAKPVCDALKHIATLSDFQKALSEANSVLSAASVFIIQSFQETTKDSALHGKLEFSKLFHSAVEIANGFAKTYVAVDGLIPAAGSLTVDGLGTIKTLKAVSAHADLYLCVTALFSKQGDRRDPSIWNEGVSSLAYCYSVLTVPTTALTEDSDPILVDESSKKMPVSGGTLYSKGAVQHVVNVAKLVSLVAATIMPLLTVCLIWVSNQNLIARRAPAVLTVAYPIFFTATAVATAAKAMGAPKK